MMLDYFYGQSGELFPTSVSRKHSFRTAVSGSSPRMPRTLYGILLDRMSLSAKNGLAG